MNARKEIITAADVGEMPHELLNSISTRPMKPTQAQPRFQITKDDMKPDSSFDLAECVLANGDSIKLPFRRTRGKPEVLINGRGWFKVESFGMGVLVAGPCSFKRVFYPDLDRCPTCKTDICDHSTPGEVLAAYKQVTAQRDKAVKLRWSVEDQLNKTRDELAMQIAENILVEEQRDELLAALKNLTGKIVEMNGCLPANYDGGDETYPEWTQAEAAIQKAEAKE